MEEEFIRLRQVLENFKISKSTFFRLRKNLQHPLLQTKQPLQPCLVQKT